MKMHSISNVLLAAEVNAFIEERRRIGAGKDELRVGVGGEQFWKGLCRPCACQSFPTMDLLLKRDRIKPIIFCQTTIYWRVGVRAW